MRRFWGNVASVVAVAVVTTAACSSGGEENVRTAAAPSGSTTTAVRSTTAAVGAPAAAVTTTNPPSSRNNAVAKPPTTTAGKVAAPSPTSTVATGQTSQTSQPSQTTAAPPATTAPPTTSAPPTTTAPSGRERITIEDFAFSPAVLNVSAGTEVEATNNDPSTHTWTADDGSWDSGNLGQGASFVHRFGSTGTFTYFCAIHPSMKGTVHVT